MTGKIEKRPAVTFGTGAAATRTSLELREGMEFNAWQTILSRIVGLAESSAWWIGDALAYGEWRYGEKYRAVLASLDLEYDRARDYAYVAGNVPAPVRVAELSWMHHRVVARLLPNDQEAWLARALEEGWSYRELRDACAAAEQTAERPAVLDQIRITIDPERLSRYQAAADRAEASVPEWAVAVLDVAAAEQP